MTVRGRVPREILHPISGVLPGYTWLRVDANGSDHCGGCSEHGSFCENDAGSFFCACTPYLGGPKKGKGGKKAKR